MAPEGPKLVARNGRVNTRFFLALLVFVHSGLLSYCAYSFSPTTDEPGHLVAGISHWKLHRFELFCITPPLTRMVAAIPVMALTDDPAWRDVSTTFRVKTHTYVGREFVSANGRKYYTLLMVARLACIPFGVLGLLVCYCWGNDLAGPKVGLLAATLWCFDPNILAHGALITADVAGASLGCLACYTFWSWLRSPTWTRLALSGVAFGLASLSSMSTLYVLYPLWLIIWIAYRFSGRATARISGWTREGVMLLACLLIGLYVLNLGYTFEGSMRPLNQFTFNSSLFTGKTTLEPGNRFRDSWFGSIPVPVPASYLLGIDQQRCDLEDYHRPSYLAGEWKKVGWWYYYCYALAIKAPVGAIAILLVACFNRCRLAGILAYRDELVLLIPPIVILAVVSIQSGFSEHLRYVLPIFPFLFIWTSQVMIPVDGRLGDGDVRLSKRRAFKPRVVAASVVWMIASSLSVYPHCLSYFNELAGGPMGGHRHLLGSNIDWGQDLKYLQWYLESHHKHDRCFLAYEETLYPTDLGLTYSTSQSVPDGKSAQSLPAGVYAISVTYLRGMPFLKRGKGDDEKLTEILDFRGFLDQQPTSMCGYSIYVYVVN